MAGKWFTPEQIINKLHEVELMFSQGATIAVVSKKIGVSDFGASFTFLEHGDDLFLGVSPGFHESSSVFLLYRKTLIQGVAVSGGKVSAFNGKVMLRVVLLSPWLPSLSHPQYR